MNDVVDPKTPVSVTPKPGTVLWHGHGQHGFPKDKPLVLPKHEADALLEHGLVDLTPADKPAEALPTPETAPTADVAAETHAA